MNPVEDNTAVIAEIRSLAEAVCTGSVTPEQCGRLNTLLLDEKAALTYAVYIRMHGLLCWHWQDQVVIIETPETPPPVQLPAGLLGGAWQGTVGFFSQTEPFSYLAATVIMGVTLLGFWAYEIIPHQHIAEAPSQSVPSEAMPEMVFVGRITGMVDVKWSDDPHFLPPLSSRAYVPLGRKYILSSGLLEITYDSGAKVILQGPCTYEVESTAGGYLALGKLTARVEKKRSEVRSQRSDHSPLSPLPSPLFSVRTPTAVVTDLGTEFGVEVSENGDSETYVFIGKVRVVATNGQGTDGQSKVIQTGQFARVKANEPLFVREQCSEEVAARFTRTMPKRLSVADAYAELVHSLNPTAYYRMERLSKDAATGCYVLADSTSGAYHGILHVDRAFDSPLWRGKYGGALNLHGLGAGEYAIVPDYPSLNGDRLSASAWVWDVGHRPDAYATILSKRLLLPSDRRTASMFFGISHRRNLYVGLVQENGEEASVIEHGREFPRGRWEYVAFVADGEVLRLYRNGVEVGSSPYRGIIHHPFSAKGLSIGCILDADHVKSDSERPGFWDGRIDELAVFQHALSAEQVWRLYGGSANAVRPSVGNGKEPVGLRARAADPLSGKDTNMGSSENREEVETNNSPGTLNREIVR